MLIPLLRAFFQALKAQGAFYLTFTAQKNSKEFTSPIMFILQVKLKTQQSKLLSEIS